MTSRDYVEITKWIVVIPIIIWVIYDWFPIFSKAKGDTISEVVVHAVSSKPILMFTIGVLVSHLFLPATKLSHISWQASIEHPWIPFYLGILISMLFWSQSISK